MNSALAHHNMIRAQTLRISEELTTQQTQKRLFDVEKTSSQVAWKTPYFRPVLKDFPLSRR